MTAQEKARKKNLSSKETFQGPAIVLQPVLYVQLNLELRTILVTQFLVLKVKLVLILTVQVSSRVLAIPCFTLIDFTLLLNSILTQK